MVYRRVFTHIYVSICTFETPCFTSNTQWICNLKHLLTYNFVATSLKIYLKTNKASPISKKLLACDNVSLGSMPKSWNRFETGLLLSDIRRSERGIMHCYQGILCQISCRSRMNLDCFIFWSFGKRKSVCVCGWKHKIWKRGEKVCVCLREMDIESGECKRLRGRSVCMCACFRFEREKER